MERRSGTLSSVADDFSGFVFRMALARTRPGPAIKESFYLVLDDRASGEEFLTYLYRAHKRWWIVDVHEFSDAPKLAPALLYRREITTAAPRDTFVAEYFDAPFSLDPDADPYAPNPRGFDPAIRGTVDGRAAELELHRRVRGLPDDEPWCDVSTAYEHYWARTLVATATGYEEGVWFLSVGVDGDPHGELEMALRVHAEALQGDVVAVIGPRPANSIAFPGTGLSLGLAFRDPPDGVDEYLRSIADVAGWAGRS